MFFILFPEQGDQSNDILNCFFLINKLSLYIRTRFSLNIKNAAAALSQFVFHLSLFPWCLFVSWPHLKTWLISSLSKLFYCHMFHYFTKFTKIWFQRQNPPIINRLTGLQILGNVPCCHTLLQHSKNVSDALSLTWSNLTLLIILALIYPFPIIIKII